MRPLDPRTIAISEHGYELPEASIAKHPLADRDAAAMLVYRAGNIQDRHFHDLPGELPKGSLLVLNNTRVIHARIAFRRASGALIECMVLAPEAARTMEQALQDGRGTRWWCMLGNAKRWKGEELSVEHDGRRLTMRRAGQQDGEHLIEFSWEGTETFLEQLDRFGAVPLPPYMRRAAAAEDDARYNTVFARHPGSVAAPTASLHFTGPLLEALGHQGIHHLQVTLHVGAGTFLPVKSTTMQDHRMHSEQLHVPRQAVERLLALHGSVPIVPVGTTALRTIESLYWFGADLAEGVMPQGMAVDQWRPYGAGTDIPVEEALRAVLAWLDSTGADAVCGTTTLLIAPGYRFRLADALITNFHQPQSTLLLLVAAFIGPRWKEVYAHALAHGYRFLSYGDGSLLWKE